MAGADVRLAWWIEDKLRTLLGVRATDVSAEFSPLLGTTCVSVYVPKEVEVDPAWTRHLDAILNGVASE